MNPVLNSMKPSSKVWMVRTACLGVLALAGLSACSSGTKKPQPTELPPVAALMGTRAAWTAQVGASTESMAPLVVGGRVFAASTAGTVVALNGATGQDVWRLNLGTPIAAGVGSDGQTAAVVTRSNQLVALADGRELWRVRLPARAFTAPLVAGARVFVLTADRTVTAFDARNGARLWAQSRTTGVPVIWRARPEGFEFVDVRPRPETATGSTSSIWGPRNWLAPETRAQIIQPPGEMAGVEPPRSFRRHFGRTVCRGDGKTLRKKNGTVAAAAAAKLAEEAAAAAKAAETSPSAPRAANDGFDTSIRDAMRNRDRGAR